MMLCANPDLPPPGYGKASPQRDSVFTKGPADVLDHATSEIASPHEISIP